MVLKPLGVAKLMRKWVVSEEPPLENYNIFFLHPAVFSA